MCSQQRTKAENGWNYSSISNPKHTKLLDKRHWSYLQSRFHITPREVQVAKLVCQGFDNEKIAKDLNIKPGTVKAHLRSLYRRVHAGSKIVMLLKFLTSATEFSLKSGIIPPIPIVDIKKPVKKISKSAKVRDNT